jgi:hypothetical protein
MQMDRKIMMDRNYSFMPLLSAVARRRPSYLLINKAYILIFVPCARLKMSLDRSVTTTTSSCSSVHRSRRSYLCYGPVLFARTLLDPIFLSAAPWRP